ncbi:hypothetical protein SporoP37_02105 [Sporosarcina sp. P37]|uniref:phage regulatory protein/antirepressor Ant n=1 Tax=unclassified Sporosarcina TaxID=2647733 RepID=UPI000A17A120|nr:MULTISPECIES: phage regulatory protein/antirepressor Ant [unclassified Sporosarcina]ARK23601.1 hypothetical protein SporoP37_02105 [Sporosarcina sp. P37]
MNQLMKADVQMTSLDIAEIVGKKHSHVMRDIRKEIDELGPEFNQSIFGLVEYTDKKGENRPCYSFGKDGAMQLALKYDAKTRYKVIKRIEELENKQPEFNLPTNFKEALYMLAESVDENDQLKQQIEDNREKVVLANAVTANDEGMLIEAAAKYMRQNGVNIGRDRLFKWLRGQGYLVSRKGREWNIPTQKSLNQGLMKIHCQLYYDSEGELRTQRQVVVTGKGLLFFINKIMHSGQLTLKLEV